LGILPNIVGIFRRTFRSGIGHRRIYGVVGGGGSLLGLYPLVPKKAPTDLCGIGFCACEALLTRNDQYWLLFPFHLVWDTSATVEDAGMQKLAAPSARARRAVSSPMPALPPITTTVCPTSSGSRWGFIAGVAVVMIPPMRGDS
jgi:hypothetical protein